MITVDGGKLVLTGTDAVLRCEFALLVAGLQSRMNSRGLEADEKWRIDDAVNDAKLYTLEYLRSEARMCADAERLSGRVAV